MKITNAEIQKIIDNNFCYIEYTKKNGENRIFESFSFKPDIRKKIKEKSNFDYNKELQNFIFGIELETGEYKRLKPENIKMIKIL